jgi:hypothetical protein
MAFRVTSASPQGASSRLSPARAVRRGDRALARNTLVAASSLCCLAVIAAGVALTSRGSAVDPDADNSAPHAASFRMALIDPAAPPVVKRDPRAPLKTPGPYLAAGAKSPTQMAFAKPLRKLPPHKPAALVDIQVAEAAASQPAQDPIAIAKAEAEAAEVVKDIGKPPQKSLEVALETTLEKPDTVTAAPLESAQPAVASADAEPAAPSPAGAPVKAASVYFASAPLADSMTTGSLGTLLNGAGDKNDEKAAASPARPAPVLATALAYAAPEPARTHAAEKLALAPVLPPKKPERPKPAHKLSAYEKLYGGPVRLASLAPFNITREDTDELPRAPYDRRTAVYVITEKKVYLPDGTVLEAHSGLGDKMDNPRYANVRMRGVTPPHVYRLKMREALFHGVEAIRMLPLGGSEAIHGRDGILAHTYMLGPSGQSNGCVSFKDYDTFLEAFKDGKIDRIAVIASMD